MWALDDARLSLAHWIQVYCSIYDMPDSEKPSEEVIYDDTRLDRWFIERESKKVKGDNVYDDSNITHYKARRSFG